MARSETQAHGSILIFTRRPRSGATMIANSSFGKSSQNFQIKFQYLSTNEKAIYPAQRDKLPPSRSTKFKIKRNITSEGSTDVISDLPLQRSELRPQIPNQDSKRNPMTIYPRRATLVSQNLTKKNSKNHYLAWIKSYRTGLWRNSDGKGSIYFQLLLLAAYLYYLHDTFTCKSQLQL